MPLSLITDIPNRDALTTHLENNPGVFIIKFGADWCEPCKLIENDVKKYFSMMPDTIQCAKVEIGDSKSHPLYDFLKSKKMVNGIPCLLAYFKDNTHYIPDEFVSGTNKTEIEYFFNTCLDQV